MALYVGTSGFAYKEWKGPFYPADLPDARMLHYYGERYGTVEINNTFYRMPKTSVVEGWAAEVPPHFRFVLKASQRITHYGRLKPEVADTVGYLLRAAAVLGERQGPLLFQLPPNLKKDVPRLAAFLALVPPPARAALEFRHPSWFDDEVFAVMREHNAALCIAQAEELDVPFVSTADWGYLRLRLPDYDDAGLAEWADRVRGAGWNDAFVFFKHEDAGKGPMLASRFLELYPAGR